MKKDPLLRQLVDDQNWHIWMDDRRSLLSYPVVSDRRQIPVNSRPSLLRLPFPLRLVGGFGSAHFGNHRGEMASMPSTASATMISIPKKRPHFRATNPLGRPSGQRTSSSSCSLILIPCTHFSQLASTLVSFPPFLLGDGRNLTVPFTSHFSSRRLLEIIESPIILARHLVLPNCETWVHESYTIALLGEAAHPNLVSRAFQRDEASDRFSRVAFFFRGPL